MTFNFSSDIQLMHVIIPVAIILILTLGIYGVVRERRRRNELMQWAFAHGLEYDPDRNYGYYHLFPDFACLQQGEDDRYAFNIMTGRWEQGYKVRAFDYHYQTHSTDSKGRRHSYDHYFSAVFLESPVPLRPLLIRPEGLFDKVGEFLGHDDIDFESAEFSKKYYVKAADRKWAYDVLHARTIEFLLGQPPACIQLEAFGVIVWGKSRFTVQEFEAHIETLRGIFDRMPDYVVRELQNQTR